MISALMTLIPAGIIILAPLAVGSVHIVTYSAMEFTIFALLLIHILKYRPVSDMKLLLLFLPFALFLLFVLMQMIPLPVSVIRFLSPNTYEVYEKLGFVSGGRTSVASDCLPLSLSVYSTSTAFLKWASYGAFFFIIGTYKPSTHDLVGQKWITILVLCVIFIGFVEALYGLYGYVNEPSTLLWFTRRYGIHNNRVAGTYVNEDHLAGLMNITIPIAVAFLVSIVGSVVMKERRIRDTFIKVVTSKKTIVLFVLLLGVILMILALIFSGSRMGQFAFGTSCIVTALLFAIRLSSKRQKRISVIFLIMMASCMSLGVLWGIWKGLDPVVERWEVVTRDFKTGRGIVWETTKPIINDFPVVGTGFGTYELAYSRYKPESLLGSNYEYAHNDYLQILAETGWIGLILWSVFFIFFLVCVIRKWLKSHIPVSIAIGAGGIASIVGILVHSIAEFNLQIPANALLFFSVMAITWRSV